MRFQRIITGLLILMGTAAISSLSFAEQNTLFIDSSDGVAFSYPSSWEKKQQRTGQFRIMVGGKNPLSGNCMLGTKSNPALLAYSDADAIQSTTAKDIENGAKQAGGEIKIVSFKKTIIGNRPAILYEADTSYQSLEFKTPLRIIAGIVKVKDRLYELGCTAHPVIAKAERNDYLTVIGSLTVRLE